MHSCMPSHVCKIQQSTGKVNLLLHLLVVKYRIAIWFFLLSTGLPATFGQTPPPAPEKGILDLSGTVLDQQTIIRLDGEWLFHWQELLTPEDFRHRHSSGMAVTVPSYWASYQLDGEALPGMGYATYSLQIILPEGYQSSICFDIPVFDVAYKLYLNERLMSSNGQVGTSAGEEEPWYRPSSFCYIPDGDTLQLLIQVSNFHHRRGGFWQSMYMGGSDVVLGRKERARMFSYSTTGVLFFFMIFFIIFWSFTRRDRVMLLFALTTLGMVIRSVNTGLYLSNFFAEVPWSWQIRMEYLGSYLAFLFGFMFLHNVFPRPYMKLPIRINTLLFSLAAVSLFLLPVKIFAYEMVVYQPLVVLVLGHYLFISFIGLLKGKLLDGVFFVSLAFFIFTLVNDILLANSAGSVSSNYLSQLSFQLFILAMAVMVVLQWISNNRERLQLETSLLFKNRVLSVIAHDLKNPVASVAQFSDLLAKKPELAAKGHVINSLRESSQAAVTLLDNLLYWGRSQAEALQISPSRIAMESLLTEACSLFQYMAAQKELTFTCHSDQGIAMYADRVLMNIVVRNLISNAIKFTPRKGSVEVRAWQEGDTIKCSVSDTGVGIKEEYLELFKKEGQIDSTTGTDQEIGTGLGLQLVRDLLEKNKGTLIIDSKMEVGSSFTMTLPADKKQRNENKQDRRD
jgi:signal transduction histidine kinase